MRGELARNYKDRVVYKSRKTAILPAFFELTLSIMRRSKADAAKTRQTILDAALFLFDEQGYAQTSLSEIARQAGVTRGAIYGHFADKEALLHALADEQFGDLFAQNAAAIAAPNTWSQLTDNLVDYFQRLNSCQQRLSLSRIIHYQGRNDESLARLQHHFEREWQNQCRAAVESGKANGEIPADADADYLYFHLSALICGLIEHYLDNPEHPDYPRYASRAIASTIALLCNQTP